MSQLGCVNRSTNARSCIPYNRLMEGAQPPDLPDTAKRASERSNAATSLTSSDDASKTDPRNARRVWTASAVSCDGPDIPDPATVKTLRRSRMGMRIARTSSAVGWNRANNSRS